MILIFMLFWILFGRLYVVNWRLGIFFFLDDSGRISGYSLVVVRSFIKSLEGWEILN